MRKDGRETWNRLLNWDKGSAPSERLSALVMHYLGCRTLDPSHPLGGKDGIKDIVCEYNGVKCVAGCYFPRTAVSEKEIKDKFEDDYKGVAKNKADGFIFITNQELTLGQRSTLIDLADEKIVVEIIHLERLSSILNTPTMYGVRLEFLDIEMTKEDQLAFYSQQNDQIVKLTQAVIDLSEKLKNDKTGPTYVEPIVISHYAHTLFQDQHHTCSSCGFGYLVKSDPYSTTSVAISAFGGSYITCPKCGNTERYHG